MCERGVYQVGVGEVVWGSGEFQQSSWEDSGPHHDQIEGLLQKKGHELIRIEEAQEEKRVAHESLEAIPKYAWESSEIRQREWGEWHKDDLKLHTSTSEDQVESEGECEGALQLDNHSLDIQNFIYACVFSIIIAWKITFAYALQSIVSLVFHTIFKFRLNHICFLCTKAHTCSANYMHCTYVISIWHEFRFAHSWSDVIFRYFFVFLRVRGAYEPQNDIRLSDLGLDQLVLDQIGLDQLCSDQSSLDHAGIDHFRLDQIGQGQWGFLFRVCVLHERLHHLHKQHWELWAKE